MKRDMYWTALNQEHSSQEIYRETLEYACDYLAGQSERPPFPTTAALANLAQFDESLPALPTAARDVLSILHTFGSPATTEADASRSVAAFVAAREQARRRYQR